MADLEGRDVWLCFVEDRHVDTTATVHLSVDRAITYASETALKYDRHGEYREEDIAGWDFYATYSCEGDCVWVVKAQVQP